MFKTHFFPGDSLANLEGTVLASIFKGSTRADGGRGIEGKGQLMEGHTGRFPLGVSIPTFPRRLCFWLLVLLVSGDQKQAGHWFLWVGLYLKQSMMECWIAPKMITPNMVLLPKRGNFVTGEHAHGDDLSTSVWCTGTWCSKRSAGTSRFVGGTVVHRRVAQVRSLPKGVCLLVGYSVFCLCLTVIFSI